MVEIRNREEFETWLVDKPREWAVVLAARSALRVLPLLAQFESLEAENPRTKSILTVFRSAALPWVVARFAGGSQFIAYARSASAAASGFRARLNRGTRIGSAAYVASTAAAVVYSDSGYLSAASVTIESVAEALGLVNDSGEAESWEMLSVDATFLERTTDVAYLSRLPFWTLDSRTLGERLLRNYFPEAKLESSWGQLKESLSARKGEDWQVWIDWYEARLHGRDPWPEEVEVACALIPNEMWEQGPAIVNAEIRRIREAWASKQAVKNESRPDTASELKPSDSVTKEQIEQLIAAVSPKPFLTDDGKLDAGRNPEFDRVVSSVDLPSLPLQQQALIRTILSDFGANSPKSVKTALEAYRDELKERGVQPILGLLNNMAAVVLAACNAKNAAIEWLDEGAQKAVELFLANHDLLVTHFPLDAEREALIAQIPVNEEAAEGRALSQPFADVLNAVKAAHSAGLTTDEFLKVASVMDKFATEVAHSSDAGKRRDTDQAAQTVTGPKKRLILLGFGFVKGAVNLLSEVVTITDSPSALAFAGKLDAALKELAKFLGLP